VDGLFSLFRLPDLAPSSFGAARLFISRRASRCPGQLLSCKGHPSASAAGGVGSSLVMLTVEDPADRSDPVPELR
jgi:hypothetical protein